MRWRDSPAEFRAERCSTLLDTVTHGPGASKRSARSATVHRSEASLDFQNPCGHESGDPSPFPPLIRPTMLHSAPHHHEPDSQCPSSRGTRFKLKQGASVAFRASSQSRGLASIRRVLAEEPSIPAPHHHGGARFSGSCPRARLGEPKAVGGCG